MARDRGDVSTEHGKAGKEERGREEKGEKTRCNELNTSEAVRAAAQ